MSVSNTLSPAFKKFSDDFFSDYNKRNYSNNIECIPQLLTVTPLANERRIYLELCVFSMLVMKHLNSVDVSTLKQLCERCKKMILSDEIQYVENFITLDQVCTLTEVSQAVDKSWLTDMVTKILDWIQKWPPERTQLDAAKCTRFLIIVVEIEALLGRHSPDFPMARKTLKWFQEKVLTTPERESGWPALLFKTLEACELIPNRDHTGIELLEQVRKLVSEKNAFRQDIAIMISKIIAACKSLVGRSQSLPFLQNMFIILGVNYDIVRDKSISSKPYQHLRSFQPYCCGEWKKHIALQIFETVREIFIIAMDNDNFDEPMVSSCSNFIIAEANVLELLDCSKRPSLLWSVNNCVLKFTKNIQKIIAKCGIERGQRTLKKFLSIQTKQKYLSYYDLTTELIKICDDPHEKIDLCAVRFICAHKGVKKYSMHQLQVAQSKVDSSKFETLPSIANKLNRSQYGMKLTFDSMKVLLYQLQVEIEYPTLNEVCRKILINEVINMDIYKNDKHSYVNLIKGNVRVLQYMMDFDHYRSVVTFIEYEQTFNEDVMTLEYENNLIKKLQKSLDCFSLFLRDKHIWTVGEDKDEFFENLEIMLRLVGQLLMVRQYKELAVSAFDLLYQVATLSDKVMAQILATGYLVENISLHPDASIEDKLVTDLQANIMKKLKDVELMSVEDLSIFLLAFLQLSKYTLRFKNNMEHVKKCMQAITKLLDKVDSKKEKFASLRLKYSELMFELIVNDSSATITPITFIEDIFHRFKSINFPLKMDGDVLPTIMYDIVNTLYGFAHARFEFNEAWSLIWTLFGVTIRKGYIFLMTKVLMLMANEDFLTVNNRWMVRLSQLDTIFQCKVPNLENGSAAPTVTWNNEVDPYIHPASCDCFQCSQKMFKLINMEVAVLKARANYHVKDYEKSLQCFQKIYGHWQRTNDLPYVSMLMDYSNCLISMGRTNESKQLLDKALDSCNQNEGTHYAHGQDISHRLVANMARDELEIDRTPSYADAEEEYEAIVKARKAASAKSKKRIYL